MHSLISILSGSRRLLVLFVALFSALCGGVIAQTPVSYPVGGKSIIIPGPSGDLVEAGDHDRRILEPDLHMSGRLVAAFIQPKDLENFRTTHQLKMDTYCLLLAPRELEFAEITPERFSIVVDAAKKHFEAAANEGVKEMGNLLKKDYKDLYGEDPANIKVGNPQLGSLFSKKAAYGFGMIIPVSNNGFNGKVLVGAAMLCVKNRYVSAFVYTPYKDEDSLKWVRDTTEHWADAILSSNQ